MQVSKSFGRKKKIQNRVLHVKISKGIDDRAQYLTLKPNYLMCPSAA
jgi:hypothetical protein